MNKYLLLFMVLLASWNSEAQYQLSGHFLDDDTRSPIPFAHVFNLADSTGVIADFEGYFSLQTEASFCELRISCVGYEDTTVAIDLTEVSHLDIALKPSVINLVGSEVVARRWHPGLKYTPVKLIDPKRLSSGLMQHSASIFSTVEGVSSISTGTNAGQPAIRGLFGSRVGVIVDGVPQQNQQWGVDHGLDIEPWLIQEFGVHKTGSGLVFGPNASAGAVEVSTIPNLAPDAFFVKGVGRGLSNTGMAEGALQLGKRWDKLSLSTSMSVKGYGDFALPAESFEYLERDLPLKDGRLVNTSGTANAQSLALEWKAPVHSFTATFRRNSQAYGLFPGIFGIPSVDDLDGDGDRRATQLPRMTSLHSVASLAYNRRYNNGTLNVIGALQQNTREEIGEPHIHGNAPLPESTLALGLKLNTAFVDVEWSASNMDKMSYFVKGQAEFQRSESEGWEFLIPDYDQDLLSVVGGVQYDIWGGELLGVARVDYQRTATSLFEEPLYNGNEEIVGFWIRSEENEVSNTNLGGSLSFEKSLPMRAVLAIHASRAVRSPSAYELSANGVHHGTFRHERGNQALTPEKGYVLDAELKRFNHWGINPFAGYYSNFIFLAPSATFSQLPEAGQVYQFEQSEVMRYGVEAFWQYELKSYEVELSGQYVNSFVFEEGAALPWTPPFSGSIKLTKNWQPSTQSNIYISPELQITSAQNQVFKNEDETPGYQLFNLRLGYTFEAPKMNIDLSVFGTNLFNTNYINHMSRYKILDLPEVGTNVGITMIISFNNINQ